MRLLFLCHRIPFPPDKGDKIRSYHELAYLAARHEVDVFTLIDDAADQDHVEALRSLVHELHVVPLRRPIAALRSAWALASGRSLSAAHFAEPELKRLLHERAAHGDYDLAFVFSSNMAPLVPETAQVNGARIPIRRVLDFVDVDSAKFLSYAASSSGVRRWLYGIEGRRLRAIEKKSSESADATVVCSEREAEELRGFARPRRLEVIGNGTDTEYFAPQSSDSSKSLGETPAVDVVFTGAMDYRANADAVVWFAKAIFPRVREQRPGTTFRIVGSNPTPAVEALSGMEGIRVTGRVLDVRPHLFAASIAVAPLLVARGIQNKVLEALACGVPVVATGAALGGVTSTTRTKGSDRSDESAVPGTLCADEPAEFAAAVLSLLDDAGKRGTLGRQGREYVVAEYRWENSLRRLEAVLEEVAHPPGAGNVAPSLETRRSGASERRNERR